MFEHVRASLQQELDEIDAAGLTKSERIIASPQQANIRLADGGVLILRAAALSDGIWIGLEFDEPVEASAFEGIGGVHSAEARGNTVVVSFEGSVNALLRAALQNYSGVQDISDTFRAGKQEVQLQLLPEARSLGLTMQDLGQQVRHAFYGYEAQRIQRGKDDIRVMVRYPIEERRSLGNLENMRIRRADGTEVPFPSVATAELARGYTTINRVDGHRVVQVIADVNRDINTPEAILTSLAKNELQDILEQFPGVGYRLAGEAEERSESMGSLVGTALLALIVIYTLLAIPLQSYLQPLVIMSVIPFGAVGAILGHLLMGMPLVFFSLLGIVALSGVVVNSSLVLVDHINKRRAAGEDLAAVIARAGSVRFRPIVLTSLTTFLGLTPIILDNTISLTPFVPMATSLAFGVLLGTLITLFLVPCLYLILEDILVFVGRGRTKLSQDAMPESSTQG